jgi:hypothetical protein
MQFLRKNGFVTVRENDRHKHSSQAQPRPTPRAGGLGGTRRERTAVSAKAFVRFVGWFPHQAANASR